jgi:DNA-binding NarL/FixJ family response regulator
MKTKKDAPRRVMVVADHGLFGEALKVALRTVDYEVVGPIAHLDEVKDLVTDASIGAAVLAMNLGGGTSFPVADLLMAQGIPFVFTGPLGSAELPSRFSQCTLLSTLFSLNELVAAVEALFAPDAIT